MSSKLNVVAKGEFSIELYSKRVSLIVNPKPVDVEEQVKALEKIYKEPEDIDTFPAFGYTICFRKEPNRYYVLLAQENLSYNTVAHESWHLTQFILEAIDADLHGDNEGGAYLNGYIVDKIIEFLIKNQIELKNDKY